MMHCLRCTGPPYAIGYQHGHSFAPQIHRSIAFYDSLFERVAKLSWTEARAEARNFIPLLFHDVRWRAYVEEMQGVGDGAGVEFEDVLALNVRTEIAYGLFSDGGCTALSWRELKEGQGATSFLAQNWDWHPDQMDSIISIHISQPGKPRIHMMTEAGITGKIGLNSSGVGVALNAVKAKGVDFSRLPVHLALRRVLESESHQDAAQVLEEVGVAAACHILTAGPSGGVGLECTAFDVVRLQARSQHGRDIITHTNHFLEPHSGPECPPDLPDSPCRLKRLNELLEREEGKPSVESIGKMLKDEANFPGSICRASSGKDGFATLFSIIMDLNNRKAQVSMGRPTEPVESLTLEP